MPKSEPVDTKVDKNNYSDKYDDERCGGRVVFSTLNTKESWNHEQCLGDNEKTGKEEKARGRYDLLVFECEEQCDVPLARNKAKNEKRCSNR